MNHFANGGAPRRDYGRKILGSLILISTAARDPNCGEFGVWSTWYVVRTDTDKKVSRHYPLLMIFLTLVHSVLSRRKEDEKLLVPDSNRKLNG